MAIFCSFAILLSALACNPRQSSPCHRTVALNCIVRFMRNSTVGFSGCSKHQFHTACPATPSAVISPFLSPPVIEATLQVAQGRNLPLPQVRELARGRIWTGEAAHGHRLVDRLGGLADAVRLAKQHAGLSLEVGRLHAQMLLQLTGHCTQMCAELGASCMHVCLGLLWDCKLAPRMQQRVQPLADECAMPSHKACMHLRTRHCRMVVFPDGKH